MKNIKTFFFLIIFISAIMASCQVPKEEQFSSVLVKALKNKDFEEFKKVAVTPKDMEDELSATLNHVRDDMQNRAAIEEYKRTYVADYRKLFNEIIETGDSLGIVWAKIKFENFLYEVKDPVVGSGLHFLNGHINFKSGDKWFYIYGIDAQEYKSGYKLNYIRTIKEGNLGKYVNSNDLPEPAE